MLNPKENPLFVAHCTHFLNTQLKLNPRHKARLHILCPKNVILFDAKPELKLTLSHSELENTAGSLGFYTFVLCERRGRELPVHSLAES